MAKLESSIIKINKLMGTAEGGAVRSAKGVYEGLPDGTIERRYRVQTFNENDNTWEIKYDEIRTILITPDEVIKIGPKGGSLLKPENYNPEDPNEGNVYHAIASKIESFSIDAEDNKKDEPYTLINITNRSELDGEAPVDWDKIPANTDTGNEKEYLVEITQENTMLTDTVKVKQAADTVTVVWGELKIDKNKGIDGVRLYKHGMSDTDYSNPMVRANGNGPTSQSIPIQVQVYVTQTMINTSGSGGNNKEEVRDGWITVKQVHGTAHNGGSYDELYGFMANNLGTNAMNAQVIYDFNEVTFIGPDGKEYTHKMDAEKYITVMQEANKVENTIVIGDETYTFKFTGSNISNNTFNISSPTAGKGTITFESYTYKEQYYVYTSGADTSSKPDGVKTYQGCTGKVNNYAGSFIKIASGSGSPGEIAGSENEFKIEWGANVGTSSRTATITITDFKHDTHTITFVQAAETKTKTLTSIAIAGRGNEQFNSVRFKFKKGGSNNQAYAGGDEVRIEIDIVKTYTWTYGSGQNSTTSTENAKANIITISKGSGSSGVQVKKDGNMDYFEFPDLVYDTTTSNYYNIYSIAWGYKEGNFEKTFTLDRNILENALNGYIQQESNNPTTEVISRSIDAIYGSWTGDSINLSTAAPVKNGTISVSSTRKEKYSYPSGREKEGTVDNGWVAAITSGKTGLNGSSITRNGNVANFNIVGNTDQNSSKTTTFKFTASGDSTVYDTISFVQPKDAVSNSYWEAPTFNSSNVYVYLDNESSNEEYNSSIYPENLYKYVTSAGGASVTLNASIKQVQVQQWYSEKTDTRIEKSYNTNCIITNGTIANIAGDKVTLADSNKTIKVPSAKNNTYGGGEIGAQPTPRLVYTVSGCKVKYNDKESSPVSVSIPIYQQVNRMIETIYNGFSLDLRYNTSGSIWSDNDDFSITNAGFNASTGEYPKMKVNSCSRTGYKSYTSTWKDNITDNNATAIIMAKDANDIDITDKKYLYLANGSSTPNYYLRIKTGTEFRFRPSQNLNSSNVVYKIYGKVDGGGNTIYDTIKLTQSAVSHALEVSPTSLTFSSSSSSAVVNVKVKTNGNVVNNTPTISENYNWISYSIDDRADLGNDGVNVNISVTSNEKANSSTSERTGTITVKHPSDSSVSKSISIRQSGRTVTTPQITSVVFDSSGSYYSMNNIYYKVTINTSAAISAGQVRMKMKYKDGNGKDIWNELNGYVLADTYGKQISLSAGSNTVSGRIRSVKWPGANYVELYVYYNGQTVGNPVKIYHDLT